MAWKSKDILDYYKNLPSDPEFNALDPAEQDQIRTDVRAKYKIRSAEEINQEPDVPLKDVVMGPPPSVLEQLPVELSSPRVEQEVKNRIAANSPVVPTISQTPMGSLDKAQAFLKENKRVVQPLAETAGAVLGALPGIVAPVDPLTKTVVTGMGARTGQEAARKILDIGGITEPERPAFEYDPKAPPEYNTMAGVESTAKGLDQTLQLIANPFKFPVDIALSAAEKLANRDPRQSNAQIAEDVGRDQAVNAAFVLGGPASKAIGGAIANPAIKKIVEWSPMAAIAMMEGKSAADIVKASEKDHPELTPAERARDFLKRGGAVPFLNTAAFGLAHAKGDVAQKKVEETRALLAEQGLPISTSRDAAIKEDLNALFPGRNNPPTPEALQVNPQMLADLSLGMENLGIANKIDYASKVVGRPVKDLVELSQPEAVAVRDRLIQDMQTDPNQVIEDLARIKAEREQKANTPTESLKAVVGALPKAEPLKTSRDFAIAEKNIRNQPADKEQIIVDLLNEKTRAGEADSRGLFIKSLLEEKKREIGPTEEAPARITQEDQASKNREAIIQEKLNPAQEPVPTATFENASTENAEPPKPLGELVVKAAELLESGKKLKDPKKIAKVNADYESIEQESPGIQDLAIKHLQEKEKAIGLLKKLNETILSGNDALIPEAMKALDAVDPLAVDEARKLVPEVTKLQMDAAKLKASQKPPAAPKVEKVPSVSLPTPVFDAIAELGKMRAKGLGEATGGEYDDLRSWGNNQKFSSVAGSLTPDRLAQELQAKGIGDGTVNSMWKLIEQEATQKKRFEAQRKAEQDRIESENRLFQEQQKTQSDIPDVPFDVEPEPPQPPMETKKGIVNYRRGKSLIPLEIPIELVRQGLTKAVEFGRKIYEAGTKDFYQWSKAMMKECGPKIKGKIVKLWEAAKEMATSGIAGSRGGNVGLKDKFTLANLQKKDKDAIKKGVDISRAAVKQSTEERITALLESKSQNIEDMRKMAADIALGMSVFKGEDSEALPLRERGKLIKTILNAETPAKLRDAIGTMARLQHESKRREALAGYRKAKKELDVKELRPEFQDLAQAFKAGVGGTVNGEPDYTAIASFLRANSNLPPKWVDHIAELSKYNEDSMSAAQLRSATDALGAIKQLNKISNKLIFGLRMVENDQAAKEAADKIKALYKDNPRKFLPLEEGKSQDPRIGNTTHLVNESMMSLADTSDLLMGGGISSEILGRGIWDGSDTGIKIRRERDNKVEALAEKISQPLGEPLKKWGNEEVEIAVSGRLQGVKDETEAKAGTESIKLTRAEKLELLAHLGDKNTRKLIDGSAVVVDAISSGTAPKDAKGMVVGFRLKKKSTGDRFLLSSKDIAEIENSATAEEKAVVDGLKQFLLESRGQEQDVHVQLEGVKFPEIPGYWPRGRDESYAQTGQNESFNKYSSPSFEDMGFHKERVLTSKAILVGNIFDDFIKHTNMASEYIGLAIPMRNARLFLGNPHLKNTLIVNVGKQAETAIDGKLNDVVAKSQGSDPASGLMSNMANAYLGYNVLSRPRQWGGQFNFLSIVDPQDLLAGQKFWASTGRDAAAEEIFNSGNPGEYFRNRAEGNKEKFIRPSMNIEEIKSKDKSMAPIQSGDLDNSIVAWGAAKNYIKRTQPKLTGEELQKAIAEKAEELARLTQNPTSPEDNAEVTSKIAKAPYGASLMGMFQSQGPKNYMSKYRVWDKYKRGEMGITEALSRMFAMTTAQVLSSNLSLRRVVKGGFSLAAGAGLLKLKQEKEKERTNLQSASEATKQYLSAVLGDFPIFAPIIGNSVDIITNSISGKKSRFEADTNPASGLLQRFSEGTRDLITASKKAMDNTKPKKGAKPWQEDAIKGAKGVGLGLAGLSGKPIFPLNLAIVLLEAGGDIETKNGESLKEKAKKYISGKK